MIAGKRKLFFSFCFPPVCNTRQLHVSYSPDFCQNSLPCP